MLRQMGSLPDEGATEKNRAVGFLGVPDGGCGVVDFVLFP